MTKLMPHTNGLTGYFTPETLDIKNKIWKNAVGMQNMSIYGNPVIEENSVHFDRSSYGIFTTAAPNIIYVIAKANSLTSEWCGLVTKHITTNSADYEFGLFSAPTSENCISINTNGGGFSEKDYTNYHIFVVSRCPNSGCLVYSNIFKTALCAQSNTQYYYGNYYINRAYRGSWLSNCGDVNIKMIAFGTSYHTPQQIEENIAFLLDDKNIKTQSRLSGADAVLQSYIMSYNKKQSYILNELSNNYINGVKYSNSAAIIDYQNNIFQDNGIVGYFDTTSIDLENKIWYNQKDSTNNITFTDAAIVDEGLQRIVENIGDFSCAIQPRVFYLICKKDEHDDDKCMISASTSKSLTSSSFTLWQAPNTMYTQSQSGAPYIRAPETDITKYNLLVMAAYEGVDSKNDNGISFFVNGKMLGFLKGHIFNNYSGKVGILKDLASTNSVGSDFIIKPTCLKFIAIGTEEHSPEQIIENSKFLMNKYMS